jgi:hypothetical protein
MVELKVYDIAGRELSVIMNSEMTAGYHSTV